MYMFNGAECGQYIIVSSIYKYSNIILFSKFYIFFKKNNNLCILLPFNIIVGLNFDFSKKINEIYRFTNSVEDIILYKHKSGKLIFI